MHVFAQLHHQHTFSVSERRNRTGFICAGQQSGADGRSGRCQRKRGGSRSEVQNLLLPAWVSGSPLPLIKDHFCEVAGALEREGHLSRIPDQSSCVCSFSDASQHAQRRVIPDPLSDIPTAPIVFLMLMF